MDKPWLLDSGASHTITSDFANLTTHSEYDGTDEVTLGDDSGLKISHTGSLSLKFPKKIFRFPDTLCVPYLCKNLIPVHHFTKHNDVFVEFHPLYFFVKDKHTEMILLRGTCSNGVYTFPKPMVSSSPKVLAYVGLVIIPPPLIPHNKMVSLNVATVILLKQVSHYFMMPTLIFPTGPMHFTPPPTLSTATPPRSCRIFPLMNIFLVSFQTTLNYENLGVSVILSLVHTIPTNSNPSLVLVFF